MIHSTYGMCMPEHCTKTWRASSASWTISIKVASWPVLSRFGLRLVGATCFFLFRMSIGPRLHSGRQQALGADPTDVKIDQSQGGNTGHH